MQNSKQTTQQTMKTTQSQLQSLSLNEKQQEKQTLQSKKIQQLRQWMKEKGCIIHPSVQIPSFINGYQGVATTAPIPPRTLIIAVPSSLILTVSKCYKDPQLKGIFTKNDQLFDYQSSDDAEFNVLCVFMMYHKLNIETSPWRVYLQTIGQPQTAIDWQDRLLKGLNKSVIEEIIHVRIQCEKLGQELSKYLKTTKQFGKYSLQTIRETFDYCYRAVMTRCFGYYFGQASLIPIADLINHGCEVVDHQLINVKYQKGIEFNESYKQKSDKIDLSLLGIKKGKNVSYPYRQKFLIQNNLVQNKLQQLTQLDRQKMNNIICEHNQKLFKQNKNIQIDDLQFCSQDDSQDNDTDVDEQHEREMELQRLQLEELEQIENFKKYYESVRVETYQQVEERFSQYEKHLGQQKQEIKKEMEKNQDSQQQSRNNMFINSVVHQQKQQLIELSTQSNTLTTNTQQQKIIEQKQSTITTTTIQSTTVQQTTSLFFDRDNMGRPIEKNTINNIDKSASLLTSQQSTTNNNNIAHIHQKAIVPIKLVQDSSSQQSQDDQQWGLQPQSYFTMSTGSAVAANKQLFNSYGSRTNRFLLIWYGFCYRNNLFDSVSLRLHVQFHKAIPTAASIVLDTYVGGQGLSFRKNEKEIVHGNEVSRQFRLKENKLCMRLLTFLRLYLLDYYKGKDLYKICVTIPSSIEFQIFVLNYYKDIITALYQRYPLSMINELKQQMQSKQVPSSDKVKINFKIIYLQQQRKILDANVDTVEGLLKVWEKIKQDRLDVKSSDSLKDPKNKPTPRQQFNKYFYQQLTITQLRKTKPYLKTLKNNYPYVIYQQKQTSTK